MNWTLERRLRAAYAEGYRRGEWQRQHAETDGDLIETYHASPPWNYTVMECVAFGIGYQDARDDQPMRRYV